MVESFVKIFAVKPNSMFTGLTRIRGRCGAIEVADTLKRTLLLYGVDIDKDIFSMTTDGASVMTKLGKSYISVPFHLLCQAHGLHLAVTDLLYKKKSKSTADSSTELEEIFSQQSIQDDQVPLILRLNSHASPHSKYLNMLMANAAIF